MLTAVVLATLAGAPRVTEPRSGLSVEPPPGTCVFIPDQPRAEGCPALEPATLVKTLGSEVWFFATSQDGNVTLVGKVIELRGAASMSSASLDEFARGAAKGISVKGSYAPTPVGDHLFILGERNGFATVRFAFDPDLEAQRLMGRVMRMDAWLIPFDAFAVAFWRTGVDDDHHRSFEALAESLQAGPTTVHPDTGLLGTDGPYRLGYIFGRLMCSLFCLGAIVWAALRLWRASKEAAAKANAPPPPPPPPAPPPVSGG